MNKIHFLLDLLERSNNASLTTAFDALALLTEASRGRRGAVGAYIQHAAFGALKLRIIIVRKKQELGWKNRAWDANGPRGTSETGAGQQQPLFGRSVRTFLFPDEEEQPFPSHLGIPWKVFEFS